MADRGHLDVVVVGAGVVGCSIAAHLLRRRPDLAVAVIERGRAAGQGSTARAAGGVRAQFASPINIALSLASIRELQAIGETVELRQHGYLFVSGTERGMAHLDLVVPLQQRLGVPVERLSPREIAARVPFMNCADVRDGSFGRLDGYLDPHSVCAAYEREARAGGAQLLLGRPVVGLRPDEVELEGGERVRARTVVCATGHWAAALLELPVVRERHHLALTGPIAGLPAGLPMVVDLDTGLHFRPEGRGLLVGWADPESRACAADPDSPPPFDPEFLERLAGVALARLPALDEAGFDPRRSWAGWYAVTPDHHAIVGQVDGVVVATGFGGHGVMHAPAVGLAVAELVLDGVCTSFDLGPLRPQRFEGGDPIAEAMVI